MKKFFFCSLKNAHFTKITFPFKKVMKALKYVPYIELYKSKIISSHDLSRIISLRIHFLLYFNYGIQQQHKIAHF